MGEFEFKIIGVEKGTRSLTSENGDNWDVESLPDAPVKPVIEVDGELLKKFEALRNDPWITNVWDFLTNANLDSRAMDNAARWYLGYVDLVPKEGK